MFAGFSKKEFIQTAAGSFGALIIAYALMVGVFLIF
jgi:hypothetical protein